MKLRNSLLSMSAICLLLACGSLEANPDQSKPLVTIAGELTNPKSIILGPDLRVAVVWMAANGESDFMVSEDLPVIASFPLRFQLDLRHAPPPEARRAPFGEPTFRGAIGAVVAYEDLNHNGRLDIVENDAPQFVDRLLGGGLDEWLIYIDSVDPGAMVDRAGKGPRLGYNRLEFRPEKECAEQQFFFFDPCGSIPALYYRPWNDPFQIVLSDDSRLAQLMCRALPHDTTSWTIDSRSGPNELVERPDHYPAKDDPNVRCFTDEPPVMPDGRQIGVAANGYLYGECKVTPLGPGPCASTKTDCSYTRWYRPDPIPADWPCP